MLTEAIFRRVRKIAKNDFEIHHVCASIHMEQFGYHGTDFYEIWYLNIFSNIRHENSSFFNILQNNGHFTWRPTYIFDHISLSSS